MAAKLETPYFGSIPPFPRHSITVHLPTWANLLRFIEREPELMMGFKSFYPRMILHKDIKELTAAILNKYPPPEGQTCLLFSNPSASTECIKFVTSSARGADAAVPASDITTGIFDIDVRLYAIFFPIPRTPHVMPFWMNAGIGISSRLAEESLKHLDLLTEVTDLSTPAPRVELCKAHDVVRERIVGLLERAPVEKREKKVQADDVYLFQTGMASIYNVHQYLLSKYDSKTVLFGFAFHSTPHVFEDFGPGSRHFGIGDESEIMELEAHLKDEAEAGRKIQAIWTEFPANPLLTIPNLRKLRQLADSYECILIIDDTVGSLCNVDVLGIADILVSSLTKSFSGYADVMGASAVLSPTSKKYTELKTLFTEKYTNDVFNGDAETLEKNSRDYLSRSKTLNNNALSLVNFLQKRADSDPSSSISKLYYPTTQPTLPLYTPFMRSPTADFVPGYGCLFSVEFKTVEATATFYDNLNVHQGPHLGAHLTLALPYTKGLYGKQLEWAKGFGLDERQVRISVGLEETEELIETFRIAVEKAEQVGREI